MNQICNNNEDEGLDSDSVPCQTRYPFAQASDSELQSLNFQEGMNMSIGGAYEIVQQESVNEAVSTALSVTSATISSSATARSGVALAAKGITAIFKILWKQRQQQTQWRQFMTAVEYLVDERIDALVRSTAISKLEGIENYLELYQEAAQDWNQDPGNAATKARILRQFEITNSLFEADMPSFRVQGFEVSLLTVYAQAANLHLLLLQDAVKFGKDWGMTPAAVDDFTNRFQRRTVDYTDYCVNTYKIGLQRASNLKANVSNMYIYYNYTDYDQLKAFDGKRYSKGEYQGTENWNLYNAYRRDMTIMVLDLISLFPTYDPKLYPNGAKIELTRELFTDIRGTTYRSDNSQNTLSAIEGRMIPNPKLFKRLTQFTFYWRQLKSTYTAGQIITGLQTTVQTTLGPSEVLPLAGSGGTSTITWNPSYGITWIDTKQWFEPRWIRFWSGNADIGWTDHGGLGTIEEKDPLGAQGPKPVVYDKSLRNSTISDHRLSWIKYEPIRSNSPFGWTEYKQLGALGLGWTHNSVDPNNTIVSDKITQIPAVKGYVVDNGATVVKGAGSTGGDLVRLPAYNEQWTQLRVKVRPSSSARSEPFRLRIRYANESNANLFVGKYVDAANRFYETGKYPVDRTFSGSMTYSAFKYLDTFSFQANEEEFNLELRCNSGGPIYIDKIEFIPLNPIEEGSKPPEPPTPSIYQIVSELTNNVLGLDLSYNRVIQEANNGGDNQKWEFVYDSSQQAYQIYNLANNSVMTWDSNGSTYVFGWPNQQRSDQYWIMENAGNGYVYLKSKKDPNQTLEVTSLIAGIRVHVGAYSGIPHQRFKVTAH